MAIIANLTPTPIPANAALGEVPQLLYHVTVTAAGGAGTYTFNHGLPYVPTFVSVMANLTEGTAPTATNAVAASCTADFSATVAAINLPGNGTYHVIYG